MKNTSNLTYSSLYSDNEYDYIHVTLGNALFEKITPFQLFKQSEWSALGIDLSKQWKHYTFFKPEPHILLFRKEKEEEDEEKDTNLFGNFSFNEKEE